MVQCLYDRRCKCRLLVGQASLVSVYPIAAIHYRLNGSTTRGYRAGEGNSVAESSEQAAIRVSVVIPTCNRREILGRCIEALAAQTLDGFEVIVVDDCSSDDTLEMLASFARENPGLRLRWLRNDDHLGANVSRNRGIEAAQGRIIAFLDSDCIAHPDWLRNLIAALDQDSVAAATGLVTDPPHRNIFELALAGTCRVHGNGEAPRLVGGNMAVRREILQEYGFDEDKRWKSEIHGGAVESPVCDEESLYLRLRDKGHSMRVVRDAVVLHEHHYDREGFLKHALSGGRAAAFLVYKYRLFPRLDVLPLLVAYASLPLVLFRGPAQWTPLALFAVACVAICYNELHRKGKSVSQCLYVLPVMFAYYHLRTFAYWFETLRLHLGWRKAERVWL